MAIVGNEIWLEWDGGVRSALHEAHIGENELADSFNAITRDGTARLDQRYILFAQVGDASAAATGSGYGIYGSGDQTEQYVCVIGSALYLLDLTDAVPAFTAVLGAGSLASGDWFFEPFEDHLYGINSGTFLSRKLLGAGVDGTGDWTALHRPAAPAARPTQAIYQPEYALMAWAGGVIVDSGAGVSGTITSGMLRITTTAAGDYWLEVTLASNFDAEYRDVSEWKIVRNLTTLQIPRITIYEGTDESDLSFWYGFDAGRSPDGNTGYFRHQNIARSRRNAITKVRFTFSAPAGTNYWTISPPKFFGVWLTLPTNYNPGDNLPVFQPLTHVYTYYNPTTGFESNHSPPSTLPASWQSGLGNWCNVTVLSSAETGVTKIRIYRVVEEDGIKTYYRLTEIPNATTTYIDKLPVDEVELLDVLVPGVLPTSGFTAITSWLRRLVLAVGPLVYISRESDPLIFSSLSGDVDELDEGRGLTFYADSRQAEDVIGIAGGESLYVLSKQSVHVLFGTVPSNWRYVRLPVSEGVVGPRAWARYSEGVVFLTPSGRLLYIQLGMAKPLELSEKVRKRIGNAGIAELATSDAVVGIRPDGQIEVRNQTGAYYIVDWEGNWRIGEHTHPTHSLLFAIGQPIRWLGTNGKIYEGGSDDYVTDGGTDGTNGVEVEGYVTTRKYSVPRMNLTKMFWGESGQSLRDNNDVLYPLVDVITRSRTQRYKKIKDKSNTPLSALDSGEWAQFKIYFDRHVTLEGVRVGINPLSAAEHT